MFSTKNISEFGFTVVKQIQKVNKRMDNTTDYTKSCLMKWEQSDLDLGCSDLYSSRIIHVGVD